MRHCDKWTPLNESIRLECFNDKSLIKNGQAFDILTASPGTCSLDKKNNEAHMNVISECRCYTCKRNTLAFGQGFNGQGA